MVVVVPLEFSGSVEELSDFSGQVVVDVDFRVVEAVVREDDFHRQVCVSASLEVRLVCLVVELYDDVGRLVVVRLSCTEG